LVGFEFVGFGIERNHHTQQKIFQSLHSIATIALFIRIAKLDILLLIIGFRVRARVRFRFPNQVFNELQMFGIRAIPTGLFPGISQYVTRFIDPNDCFVSGYFFGLCHFRNGFSGRGL
jgi:hypothetical protein